MEKFKRLIDTIRQNLQFNLVNRYGQEGANTIYKNYFLAALAVFVLPVVAIKLISYVLASTNAQNNIFLLFLSVAGLILGYNKIFFLLALEKIKRFESQGINFLSHLFVPLKSDIALKDDYYFLYENHNSKLPYLMGMAPVLFSLGTLILIAGGFIYEYFSTGFLFFTPATDFLHFAMYLSYIGLITSRSICVSLMARDYSDYLPTTGESKFITISVAIAVSCVGYLAVTTIMTFFNVFINIPVLNLLMLVIPPVVLSPLANSAIKKQYSIQSIQQIESVSK